ncbi:MAG TPA: hypothetical protein PK304_03950 [Mobilitalea sp.]|nr:hypothetical protein [Mobilitalea sp.]
MDKYDDSRATPKKRTKEDNDNYTDISKDNNSEQKNTPEIIQPNPPSATPSHPVEMPSRELRDF